MYQGDKYRGPGMITQGDLKAEVECEYEVSRVDGATSWHGRFVGAKPTSEPEPGAARAIFEHQASEALDLRAGIVAGLDSVLLVAAGFAFAAALLAWPLLGTQRSNGSSAASADKESVLGTRA